jgi:hypothetical protein
LLRRAGIDHILAGGAEMHPFGGLGVDGRDAGGQRLDQGNRRVGGERRRLADGGDVVERGIALRCDDGGGLLRDHPHLGFGPGQRRLEIQHALQRRAIVEERRHLAVDEEFAEEARGAAGHGDAGAMRRAGRVVTHHPLVSAALVPVGAFRSWIVAAVLDRPEAMPAATGAGRAPHGSEGGPPWR